MKTSHRWKWLLSVAFAVLSVVTYRFSGLSGYAFVFAVVSAASAAVDFRQALGCIKFLKRKAQVAALLVFSILGYRSTSVGSFSRPQYM